MLQSRQEYTGEQEVLRGRRAAVILGDEVYQDAVELARRAFYEQWLASSKPADREACWAKTHALEAIETELRGIVSDGEVAASKQEDE